MTTKKETTKDEKSGDQENVSAKLQKLGSIVSWFENQEEIDVEKGLELIKEGAVLIKESKERLKEIENEFTEIKKELSN